MVVISETRQPRAHQSSEGPVTGHITPVSTGRCTPVTAGYNSCKAGQADSCCDRLQSAHRYTYILISSVAAVIEENIQTTFRGEGIL